MRILVTNDDGYDAPGLVAVARSLVDAGHEVTVGAPQTERSGSGSSLGTIEDGAFIPVIETTLPSLGSVPVYGFDCTPALTVVACCAGVYGPPPELVVSGINPGHNTGQSILFSSTVGALLAARIAGIGGLAVSCGFAPGHRFDTAADVTSLLVDWMTESGSARMSLNVNVPDVDVTDLRGIRVAELATRSMFSIRMARADNGLVMRRDDRSTGFHEGTDSAVVAAGHVAVTALRGIVDDNTALARHQSDGAILGALHRIGIA